MRKSNTLATRPPIFHVASRWSGPYLRRIIASVKAEYPNVPLTLYANGSGGLLERLAATGADVIGVDWTTDMADARARIPANVSVQGNVDPAILFASKVRREGRGGVRGGSGRVGAGVGQDVGWGLACGAMGCRGSASRRGGLRPPRSPAMEWEVMEGLGAQVRWETGRGLGSGEVAEASCTRSRGWGCAMRSWACVTGGRGCTGHTLGVCHPASRGCQQKFLSMVGGESEAGPTYGKPGASAGGVEEHLRWVAVAFQRGLRRQRVRGQPT